MYQMLQHLNSIVLVILSSELSIYTMHPLLVSYEKFLLALWVEFAWLTSVPN